jgi:hypothetical protein
MSDLAIAPGSSWETDELTPEFVVPALSRDPRRYAQQRAPRSIEIKVTRTSKAPADLPGWVPEFIARVDELVDEGVLDDDWNGHGASGLDPQAVVLAIRAMVALLGDGAGRPMPDVIPTFRGGLQLEWHLGAAELEVDVDPNGTVEVFFNDSAQQKEWGGTLSERESDVRDVLDRYSSGSVSPTGW